MQMRRLRIAACAIVVIGATLLTYGARLAAAADAADGGRTRVLLAFFPSTPVQDPEDPPPTPVLDRLDAHPSLSLGLTGATQSRYSQAQALLDFTAGTRVSAAAYAPEDPPDLAFYRAGRGALVQGWLAAKSRADTAPADIVPGLLAERVPGGVAYVGVTGRSHIEAIAAANRAGRIREVSIGRASDVAERARRRIGRYRLVVAGLPTSENGADALDELVRARRPGELLIVMQLPPEARAPQLLPTGVIGLGGPGALTSTTTRLDGIVAGIDVLPTILGWLRVEVPGLVKGQALRVEGERDADALETLRDRLRVVGSRRFPALETVLALWLGVLLVLAIAADRRGVRTAMRLGALALLWVLPVLLVTAALRPARTVELGIVAVGTFVLAAITDRLLPWPRGPALPAGIAVVAYVVDLVRGSDLIIQSLLGPNPRFGSRYYGIGNELEASLPVLLFFALAVLLAGRGRSRAGALAFAAAGAALGAAIGAGRLGADVGGVITVGAGTAVAVLFMLPGGVTRRAFALAVVAPAAALAGLAAIDLATGGNAHFTRTVLRAEGQDAIGDIVVRRYELAFNVLKRGLMPFATAIAVLTIVYGLRYRERLYAPLAGDAAWTAAMAGSLAAAVAGALSNDSGPLLLLFGAFLLTTLTIYIRGDPRLAAGNPVQGAG
jgi:hypothetical protein